MSYRIRSALAGLQVAAALVGVVALFNAAPASAATAGCGEVLTRDTTLEADLTCPGDGLIIGADRITVNLNGHTILAACSAPPCPSTAGIDNGDGYDRVQILNGTVRFFEHNILLDGADRNILKGLNVAAGGYIARYGSNAIRMTNSNRNVIADSTLTGGDPAVFLSGSDENTISHSSISGGADIRVGDGLVVEGGSDDNRIERSSFAGLNYGALVVNSDGTLFSRSLGRGFGAALVLRGADGTEVSRNTLQGGQGESILASDSDRSQIRRNVGTSAFVIEGDANDVERNEAHRPVFGGAAILIAGDANEVVRNEARGSGSPEGGGPAIDVTRGDGNMVSRNDASGSLDDAVIHVRAAATNTLVVRNLATHGQGDGIRVDAPGSVITKNTARDNSGLGINAVAGVVDGGGNRASANGNPLQCVNVACKP